MWGLSVNQISYFCYQKQIIITVFPWVSAHIFLLWTSTIKGATSRMAHLSLPFAIHLNLLHPQPSLFLFGLLLPRWCFSTLVNYDFEAFFDLKVILHFAKMTLKILWHSSFKAALIWCNFILFTKPVVITPPLTSYINFDCFLSGGVGLYSIFHYFKGVLIQGNQGDTVMPFGRVVRDSKLFNFHTRRLVEN